MRSRSLLLPTPVSRNNYETLRKLSAIGATRAKTRTKLWRLVLCEGSLGPGFQVERQGVMGIQLDECMRMCKNTTHAYQTRAGR
mmetsp:Transcript_93188/g.150463  ORF Transcript_93188/g.150463 Transcript_93188/m.150463 type:complete len:84 (-) Transcript_93188:92-343(-)